MSLQDTFGTGDQFTAADEDAVADAVNTNTTNIAALSTSLAAKYTKPGGGIPESDFATAVQTLLTDAGTAYQKPGGGIAVTDLSSTAQTELGEAATAYQKPGGGVPETDLAAAVQALLTEAATAMQPVAATAVQTGAYTAQPGDLVLIDTTSAAVPVALPTAPANNTRVAAKVVNGTPGTSPNTLTHVATLTCGGSDALNKTGGSTTYTLSLLGQAVTLQYKTSTALWYVISDDTPLAQLDARYNPDPYYNVKLNWLARNPGNHTLPDGIITYYNKANTPWTSLPTTTDTGQNLGGYSTGSSSTPTAQQEVAIVGGALQLPRSSTHDTSASYVYLDSGAGNTLTRLGMKFRFDNTAGATTVGAAVCLAQMNMSTVQASNSAFRIGVHFTLSQSTWTFQKATSASGAPVFTTLATGTLENPLKWDSTEYRVEIWRVGGVVYALLPDGETVNSGATDSDVASWSTQWGFFEPYMVFSDTDVLPEITEAWYGINTAIPPGNSGLVTRYDLDQLVPANAAKLATARLINDVPFDGSASIKLGGWSPGDFQGSDGKPLIAWVCDPVSVFQSGPLTAGFMFVVGLWIPVATTITNILLNVLAAGSGLTSGQCFAALYQGGALKSATADQSTNWASVGLKTIALATPQAVTAGAVYVGMYANGTTPPSISTTIEQSDSADHPAQLLQLVGASYRFGYDSTHTGLTTAPPSTLGAIVPQAEFWTAVS